MSYDGDVDGERFSKKPLYRQLRDALAERIATGSWRPGVAIPNESDLAREFGVSAGTMRKALDMMEAERLLSRRQGRGTFVNDQAADGLALRFNNLRMADGEHLDGQTNTTHVAEHAASDTERLRLQLGPEDRIFHIHRTRLRNDKPFMVEHAAVPAALFRGLDAKTEVPARIPLLAQQYGVLLGHAEERVSVGPAPQPVAEALGIPPGTPVMVLDRIVQSLDSRPVEWRMAWCHLTDEYYRAEMI
jgi:GntR family transcriptional regulator